MVAAGELHAAMCFQDAALPPRRPEGTERHELGTEAMLAVLALDHPLAGRERDRASPSSPTRPGPRRRASTWSTARAWRRASSRGSRS